MVYQAETVDNEMFPGRIVGGRRCVNARLELARLAGVSSVTIGRIERGEICRMKTSEKLFLPLATPWRIKKWCSPTNSSSKIRGISAIPCPLY